MKLFELKEMIKEIILQEEIKFFSDDPKTSDFRKIGMNDFELKTGFGDYKWKIEGVGKKIKLSIIPRKIEPLGVAEFSSIPDLQKFYRKVKKMKKADRMRELTKIFK